MMTLHLKSYIAFRTSLALAHSELPQSLMLEARFVQCHATLSGSLMGFLCGLRDTTISMCSLECVQQKRLLPPLHLQNHCCCVLLLSVAVAVQIRFQSSL